MTTNSSDRKLLLCATALTALSLGACAEPATSDADADATPEPEIAAQQAPVNVPNPEGSYFADVFANGSGCPQGSWNVSISPDGQVFTATFSKYEVDIAPETADPLVQRDCTLSVQLHSPQGLSYAITSFLYSGYAFLEEGVTGRLSARYWFQGNPIPPTTSNRTDLVGPYDQSFLFKDDVETKDQVFSACGTTRDLNVNTRLQIVNSSPKRSGYANVAAIDGRTELKFGLSWRKCDGGSTGSTPSGTPGGSASTPTTPSTPAPTTPSNPTPTTPTKPSGNTTTPSTPSTPTVPTTPTTPGGTTTTPSTPTFPGFPTTPRTPTTGGGTVTRGGTIGGVTRSSL
ncbi:MAG: DUF4360 domain-containing protein [Polyangiales bacterium]